MKCPVCQAAIQPGARFCIACGATLASTQPATDIHAHTGIEPLGGQHAAVVVVPAPKAKGTALAIEAVAAFFGIFGVGWLYSGNTTLGIAFLLAGFCWAALVFIVTLVSFGFGLLCLAPVHMALVVGSVLLLNIAASKANR